MVEMEMANEMSVPLPVMSSSVGFVQHLNNAITLFLQLKLDCLSEILCSLIAKLQSE